MVNNYYIKYFVDSVALQSLSKSAKKNHISTAAVSLAIKNLEESFDLKLIQHQRNRFQLTSEGLLFYEKARKLLKEVTYFVEDINNQSKTLHGKVTFATNSALAHILLPTVLSSMKKKYPDITLDFKAGYSSTVKHYTLQGDADFGMNMNFLDMSKQCHSFPLTKGRYVLVKKKGSSRDQKFLLTEDGLESKMFKKSYKNHFKIPTPIEMNVPSWEVILQMSLAGLGIGMIPDFYLWNLDKKLYSIQKMPFDLPIFEVEIYVLKKRSLSPQAQKLISEIRNTIEQYKSIN